MVLRKNAILLLWALLGLSLLSCTGELASTTDTQSQLQDKALEVFLDTHPGLGQDIARQTVRIMFFDQDDPKIFTFGSGIIVDDRHLLTASHLLRDVAFQNSGGGWMPRSEEVSVLIHNALGEPIFRIDASLEELLGDAHPKMVVKTPLSILDVVGEQLLRSPNTDIAVLKLKQGRWSQSLGRSITPITIDPNLPKMGDVLYSLGYGRASTRLGLHATSFEVNSRVGISMLGGFSNMIARYVSYPETRVFSGDSGGPLIVSRKNGKISLVGLINAATQTPGLGVEFFVTFRVPLVEMFLQSNSIPLAPKIACPEL